MESLQPTPEFITMFDFIQTTHSIPKNAHEIILNGQEIALTRNNSDENDAEIVIKGTEIILNDANIHNRVLFYTNDT